MPVAVAVFDMGKRGHKKNRVAVLFMALVISASFSYLRDWEV